MKSLRFHLIIDLDHCQPTSMVDVTGLEEFLKKLVASIDMKVLKGPLVAEGIPANPGISGFVIIDFSHCSIHTFSNHQEAMVDIFSCKEFDIDMAMKMAKEYFATSESEIRFRKIWWGE
jgi:S-adenosylmethionine decarboxylase